MVLGLIRLRDDGCRGCLSRSQLAFVSFRVHSGGAGGISTRSYRHLHRCAATLSTIRGAVNSKSEARKPSARKLKPTSQTVARRPSPRQQILALRKILRDLPQWPKPQARSPNPEVLAYLGVSSGLCLWLCEKSYAVISLPGFRDLGLLRL